MTEICYVEDDCDIAQAVEEYLTRRGLAVTVCATLGEAKRAIGARVPALALLDQNLPDGHGDELCRWIRRNYKELPVMVLTVCGDAADIVLSFQNGADDYVVKPFELEVLYARILALLRRSGDVSGQYLSCGGITIDQNRRSVSCSGEEISVSAAEYELLLYLMRNQGRTLTRERILAQVWDVNGSFVNDNTLTVTMKRLRDKLHQPSCIRTVRSVGYRMEEV